VIFGLYITQVAVIGFLLVLIVMLGWVYLAGDTEGDMVDDESPTLDVQNHEGDR
jgi:hypothetical protein